MEKNWKKFFNSIKKIEILEEKKNDENNGFECVRTKWKSMGAVNDEHSRMIMINTLHSSTITFFVLFCFGHTCWTYSSFFKSFIHVFDIDHR